MCQDSVPSPTSIYSDASARRRQLARWVGLGRTSTQISACLRSGEHFVPPISLARRAEVGIPDPAVGARREVHCRRVANLRRRLLDPVRSWRSGLHQTVVVGGAAYLLLETDVRCARDGAFERRSRMPLWSAVAAGTTGSLPATLRDSRAGALVARGTARAPLPPAVDGVLVISFPVGESTYQRPPKALTPWPFVFPALLSPE